MSDIALAFESSDAEHKMAEIARIGRIAVEEGGGLTKQALETINNNRKLIRESSELSITTQEIVEAERTFCGHPGTFVGRRERFETTPLYKHIRTTIHGREYSAHAIERMQKRGLTPLAVENTIEVGVVSLDPKPGRLRHYDQINSITVITDQKTGTVISASFGKR